MYSFVFIYDNNSFKPAHGRKLKLVKPFRQQLIRLLSCLVNLIILCVCLCALWQQTPRSPLLLCQPALNGWQTSLTSCPSSPCAPQSCQMMTCATLCPADSKPLKSVNSTEKHRPSLWYTAGRCVLLNVSVCLCVKVVKCVWSYITTATTKQNKT